MSEQNSKVNKVLWWSLISAAGLAIILGWTIFVAPRLVPWEKIKLQAEKRLSDTLHHSVTIGSIGFNLFRGVEVHQLKVGNAPGFSATPLLAANSATVHYRLLPLLWGKVMIKAILLDRPSVLIERTSDGRFNFSDMLPAKNPAPPQPAAGRPRTMPAKLPLELLVSRLAILQGSLTFRDLKSQKTYAVSPLEVEVRNLNLAGLAPVKVALSALVRLQGLNLPVKASADWRLNYSEERFVLDRLETELPGLRLKSSGKVESLLTAPNLNLTGSLQLDMTALQAGFRTLLQDKLPRNFQISGTGQVDFSLSGPAQEPAALGITLADAVDLKVSFRDLSLPVTLKGSLTLAAGNLGLQQRLLLPGLQAELAGRVGEIMTARQLEAKLNAKLDLAAAGAKLLPPAEAKKLSSLETEGRVTVEANLSGPAAEPDKFAVSAKAEASGIGVAYEGRELLSGLAARLQIRPDQIDLPDLRARLGGQEVTASLSARGFDLRHPDTLKAETMRARVDWKLASPMLDVDALLALAPRKKSTTRVEVDPETVSDLPEPDARELLPAGLSLQGTAALGGLKFGKVKLGKMDFSLGLKQRLLNESGTLLGYQGSIQQKVRLDFTRKLLAYTVEAQAKGVDVEPLMNDVVDTFVAAKLKRPEILAELKSKLTGSLSGSLNLKGEGMRTVNAKPRLAGQGAFTLADGKIRQFPFQENLAGWFGSEKFKQDIPFDQTVVEFKLGQQMAEVMKFIAQSGAQGGAGDIRLWAQGPITFDADFKDFKLRPSLNPRASASLSPEFRRYTEVMKDDRGWVVVPVLMNGPIKKPNVQPDWEWIKKQFGSYADKKIKSVAAEAGDKAKSFLQKQQGKQPEQIKQDVIKEIDRAKEQMKSLDQLKNLFNR